MWQRLAYRPWLKLFGITAFMWVFFSAYFQTLRHPVYPVLTMPLTPLDLWIPFQPLLLGAYMSLWLYVSVAPGMMRDWRAMLRHGLWVAALCLAGLLCFHFWPTAVPHGVPIDLLAHPTFALLRGVDAAGNACPSLHVAAAAFTAASIHRQLRALGTPWLLPACNAAWFAVITYSTLAIKQHVVLDVLAGLLLGGVFAWLAGRWAGSGGGRRIELAPS